MTYTFEQGTSDVGTNVSSLGKALPNAVKAGSLLFGVFQQQQYNQLSGVGDSQGNVWTVIGTYYDNNYAYTTFAYAYNVKAGATTVGMELTSGDFEDLCLAVCEYSGIATAAPLDQGTSAANATSNAGPTAAIAAVDELVIGAIGFYDVAAAGPGFTLRENSASGGGTNYIQCAIEDLAATSTAGQSASFTPQDNCVCGVYVFKLAGGPAPASGPSWGAGATQSAAAHWG